MRNIVLSSTILAMSILSSGASAQAAIENSKNTFNERKYVGQLAQNSNVLPLQVLTEEELDEVKGDFAPLVAVAAAVRGCAASSACRDTVTNGAKAIGAAIGTAIGVGYAESQRDK